jgi:xanthosine utilization system XapX-like protein
MTDHATPGEHGDHNWRRAAARRAMLPVAIALIGIVGVIAGEGTLRIVAWGVVGVAITVATALVFLEVGYSEDRARTRDSASASSTTPRPPSPAAPRRGPSQGRRRM